MGSSQARVLGDISILPAVDTALPPALLGAGFIYEKLTVTQRDTIRVAANYEPDRRQGPLFE